MYYAKLQGLNEKDIFVKHVNSLKMLDALRAGQRRYIRTRRRVKEKSQCHYNSLPRDTLQGDKGAEGDSAACADPVFGRVLLRAHIAGNATRFCATTKSRRSTRSRLCILSMSTARAKTLKTDTLHSTASTASTLIVRGVRRILTRFTLCCRRCRRRSRSRDTRGARET